MNLLAFELSTERCSVALLIDGDVRQRAEAGNRPSRHILAMAHALLADAELSLGRLDAIAFGRGPGAFTGLRIAAGVTQGLAFGAELPVVPVSSLAALAQRAVEDHDCEHIVAVLDARMDEIYSGAFRRGANGLVIAVGEEQLCPPQNIEIPFASTWCGAGPGWETYPVLATKAFTRYPEVYPDAAAVARLGTLQFTTTGGVDAAEALPVYLRDTVAWQKTR